MSIAWLFYLGIWYQMRRVKSTCITVWGLSLIVVFVLRGAIAIARAIENKIIFSSVTSRQAAMRIVDFTISHLIVPAEHA